MVWLALGVIVIAGTAVLVVNVKARRRAGDLGSVSVRWIARHRRDWEART